MNDIPILACISEKGMVKQVNGKDITIDLPTVIAVERARLHLLNLPVTIVPDEDQPYKTSSRTNAQVSQTGS